MIIDKLFERVRDRGPVCVGLDTDVSYIPDKLLKSSGSQAEAVYRFNCGLIDATASIAGCFKVQIAYYEALGLHGMKVYADTLAYLRKKDAVIIADVKRGDIAKTAEMYAQAHFSGDFEADFITVNPFMGMDTLEPFLPYVKSKEKGLFVLLRTSNPGAEDIQYLTVTDNRRVYSHLADNLKVLADKNLGSCGYSSLGAVMGCTHPEEGIELRKTLKSVFFLIPGYGAQGGTAEDVAQYMTESNGGVVNASRSILLAWKKSEKPFDEAARDEVLSMRSALWKSTRR